MSTRAVTPGRVTAIIVNEDEVDAAGQSGGELAA
jgi:hypothetical protein